MAKNKKSSYPSCDGPLSTEEIAWLQEIAKQMLPKGRKIFTQSIIEPDDLLSVDELIARLSPDQQQEVRAKAETINRARALARRQEDCVHDWQRDGQTPTAIRWFCQKCFLSKME
ncbi:MAG: hypothetical protein HY847_10145 [Betaproteobacteria bacterium]|nr:hypothetical protein [Betaproteobacteria bacterium]